MRPRHSILPALLVLLMTSAAAAQPGSRGTEFWLTFMQSLRWSVPEIPSGIPLLMRVSILSENGATCRVEVPGIGWATTVLVPAGGETTVTLPPTAVYPFESDSVQALAVHVVASDSVTVVAMNYTEGSADATLVLPFDQLGDDYVVSAYDAFVELGEQYYPSELAVVAGEDATVVEIVPSVATTTGRPAGVPYTVTLQRGEVYQVQSWENLAGTRVRGLEGVSCRRFAVFAGAVLTLVGDCEAGDHLYEQQLPVDHWGREHLAVPLATRSGGEIYEIVAARDGTQVTVDGGPPITLQSGGVARLLINGPARIASSEPVAVAAFARGGRCDGNDNADPFMVMVPPRERATTRVRWIAYADLRFTTHFVNVALPTTAVASVRLDGVAVTTTFVPFVGDPTWSWAQIPVTPGPHALSADEPMAATAYGFARPVSYGYACGLQFEPPPVYSFTARPLDSTWCVGQPIEFVETTSGGTFTLEWDFGDGRVATGSRPTHRYDSAGTYTVRLRARTGRSCAGESVLRDITIAPLPPTPEITAACGCDSVVLSAPDGYVSYRWSTGDTSRRIVVRTGDTVAVAVTTSAGCEATSRRTPVSVPGRGARVTVTLERTEVEPGGLVPVRLRLAPDGNALCSAPVVRLTLSHSSTMLAPDFIRGGRIVGDTVVAGRRLITIEPRLDTVLLELIAGLGADTTSEVVVESVATEACGATGVRDTIGIVALAGICREGGVRLFLNGDAAALKPVTPNPATGIATAEFVALEDGPASLTLYDARGSRVLIVRDGVTARGAHTASFDVSSLPSGRYYLVLSVPSGMQMRSVLVGER